MRKHHLGPTELWNYVLDRCVVSESGCWLWEGSTTPRGYAVMNDENAHRVYVHRWIFEQAHRPLEDGETVDHTCHHGALCSAKNECEHRRCLNPAHLAAEPRSVNAAKQDRTWRTHCPHGHEYTEVNTYRRKSNGNRQCKKCAAVRMRNRRAAA